MATFESPNGRHYQSTGACSRGSFGTVHKCIVREQQATLSGYVAVKVVSWKGNGLDRKTVLSEKVALETITPHDGIIRLLDSWVNELRNELCTSHSQNGILALVLISCRSGHGLL